MIWEIICGNRQKQMKTVKWYVSPGWANSRANFGLWANMCWLAAHRFFIYISLVKTDQKSYQLAHWLSKISTFGSSNKKFARPCVSLLLLVAEISVLYIILLIFYDVWVMINSNPFLSNLKVCFYILFTYMYLSILKHVGSFFGSSILKLLKNFDKK